MAQHQLIRIGAEFEEPPGTLERVRRAGRLAKLLMIGVPRAEAPGLEALGVVLVRLPLQALALSLLAAAALVFCGRLEGAPQDLLERYGAPAGLLAATLALELNRYGFARSAARRVESLRLFTVMTVLAFGAALLAAGASPTLVVVFAAAEILASAALCFGLAYPEDLGVLLFGLVTVHAAVFEFTLLLTPAG